MLKFKHQPGNLKVNMRDKVPHPDNTAGKNILPYIFIFIFLDSKQEDKTKTQ